MYLPALPALGLEFGASPGHVQLSVASFFLGLAVGQGLRFFEWRAIFWAMALLGAMGLAGSLIRLRETHTKKRTPLILGNVLSVYGQLLRDRAFVGYVLTGGMAMAGMFAYIVGSPYVFIEHFHVPTGRFGLFFGINALGL